MPKKRASQELGPLSPAKKACIPAFKVSELIAKTVPEPTRGTFDYRFNPLSSHATWERLLLCGLGRRPVQTAHLWEIF